MCVCVFFLAKINETDTFGPGDDDEIQFDDIGDDDEDIDDVSGHILLFLLSVYELYTKIIALSLKCHNTRTREHLNESVCMYVCVYIWSRRDIQKEEDDQGGEMKE